MEFSGALAKLNFEAMTDSQLARIAAGEHPYAVLAPTRDSLSSSAGRDTEILRLPPAQEEGSAG